MEGHQGKLVTMEGEPMPHFSLSDTHVLINQTRPLSSAGESRQRTSGVNFRIQMATD